MSLRNLVSLFSRKKPSVKTAHGRKRSRPARRTRLSLEPLEDRLNLAYLGFTNLTGAANPLNGFDFDFGARSAPALGDMDRDGRVDVLVGAADGTLTYLGNTGTAISPVYAYGKEYEGLIPLFGDPNDPVPVFYLNPFSGIDVGENAAPALGDVDRDGDLDALVGAGNGTLTYLENTGTAISPIYEVRLNSGSVFDVGSNSVPALGDVDGDGDLDLLVGAGNGTLTYVQNTGTATSPNFAFQTSAANPFFGFNFGSDSKPTLGDVDRDGDLDLLVGSGNGTLFYLKNTGTVSNPVYVDQGAASPFSGIDVGENSAPALGNLDGDGDLDVLVGAGDGTLFFLRNDAVPPAVNYTSLSGPVNPFNRFSQSAGMPALGDMDVDGDLDALLGNNGGNVLDLKNTATAAGPLFDSVDRIFIYSDLPDPAPALGDVDGDGDLDLLVGLSAGYPVVDSLYFVRNRGNAIYADYEKYPSEISRFESADLFGFSGGFFLTPVFGDVDGDGDLDAFVGDVFGVLRYLKNIGTATSPDYVSESASNPFNINLNVEWSESYLAPALGDLDGDGDLDLLVGGERGILHYLENIGTATSPVYKKDLDGQNQTFYGFDFSRDPAPALGDVDRDGDLDVVVGSRDAGAPMYYLRANRTPVVDMPIPDQTFSGPGSFSYTVPANTFLDLDRDTLTFDATLGGVEPLPPWLTFNRSTRTFSGNPETLDASSMQIRVSANDADGKYAYDDFELTLNDVGDYTNLNRTTGEILVRGGEGDSNDSLTLIPTQFGTYIVVNDRVSLFGSGISLTNISIDLGGGTNLIDLKGTPANIPVNIHGSGTDTVNIGSGFSGVQNVRGNVSIENEASGTTINIDDRANTSVYTTAHMGTIKLGEPGWGYITDLAPADILYKYAGTTSITIHTSTADGDIFGVWENGVPTTLVTHGQAAVDVGDVEVGLDGLLGPLTVKGNGQSTLTINDQQGTGLPENLPAGATNVQTSLVYSVTAHIVSRAASFGYISSEGGGGGSSYREISYQGITKLELNGSNHDAVIDVQGTAAGTPVTINTTYGVNTVSVHHTDANGVKTLQSDVQVNGGGGQTTVEILDQANPQTPVIVGPAGITIGDPVTIGYSNVQSVTLYAAISVDYDIVNDPPAPLAPPASIAIYLGAGPNTVHVAPDTLAIVTIEFIGSAPVTFDHSADTIDAAYIITSSTVQVNGSPPINYSGAGSLTVKGGSGNDTFNVVSTSAATPVTVNTGAGNDLVNVLATTGRLDINNPSGVDTVTVGNTRAGLTLGGDSLGNVQGDIYVSGLGATYLYVDDSHDTVARNATISYDGTFGTLAGSAAPGLIRWMPSTPSFDSGVIAMDVYAGTGANTFTVNNTGRMEHLYLTTRGNHGAAGQVNLLATDSPTFVVYFDTIIVGSLAPALGGTVDNIKAPVYIRNDAHQTNLIVDDSGNTTGRTATVYDGMLTGLSPAPIQFTYFNGYPLKSLTVYGGSGNDTFEVQSTAPGTTTLIDTGRGADRIEVGNNRRLSGIKGALHVQSATSFSGVDLFLDDYGELTPKTQVVLDDGFVTGLAPATISWTPSAAGDGGITGVYVLGGQGGNTFTVKNTSLLYHYTYLVPGVGANQVDVQGMQGNLIVSSVYGSVDAVTIGSQAPSLGGTLANITGDIYVQGGGGSTSLIVDDTGTTSDRIATVTATGLTWQTPAAIHWVPGVVHSVTLNWGSGNDSFRLPTVLPPVPLTLDGGGGTNTLDYSAFTTGVLVNLAVGTGTGLAGLSGIQNVTGGAGPDVLIGNTADNVLRGGSGNDILVGGAGNDRLFGNAGRDILIGGLGVDRLKGGAGDDILIGGYTDYDTQLSKGVARHNLNLEALNAILAEWASSHSYNARFGNIKDGVGRGGKFLLSPTTVHNDGAGDTLTGGDGQDWFFTPKKGEAITDLDKKEQTTSIK